MAEFSEHEIDKYSMPEEELKALIDATTIAIEKTFCEPTGIDIPADATEETLTLEMAVHKKFLATNLLWLGDIPDSYFEVKNEVHQSSQEEPKGESSVREDVVVAAPVLKKRVVDTPIEGDMIVVAPLPRVEKPKGAHPEIKFSESEIEALKAIAAKPNEPSWDVMEEEGMLTLYHTKKPGMVKAKKFKAKKSNNCGNKHCTNCHEVIEGYVNIPKGYVPIIRSSMWHCCDTTCNMCWEKEIFYDGIIKSKWMDELVTPRTQKAKGLRTLTNYGIGRAFMLVKRPAQAEYAWDHRYEYISYNGLVMARPCPPTPRHGFVESRLVHSAGDIRSVLEETLAVDPMAEVLVMQYIPGDYNIVWSPGMLAVGPGTNGATGGKGSVEVPLVHTLDNWTKDVARSAGVKDPDAPYMEFVGEESTIFCVQIRAGVQIGLPGNQIPERVVVERVVEAEGDLIEWSERMKKVEPGTVVYHPGGTQGSHYAVWCKTVQPAVPIVFDKRPEVGDVLEPTRQEPIDYVAVARGIGAGLAVKITLDNAASMTYLAGVGLHNSAAMTGRTAFWVGAAAVIMVRLGIAACRGEYRHLRVNGKQEGGDRNKFYRSSFKSPLVARRGLAKMVNGFYTGHWGGQGYGGPKWSECARATMELDTATKKMAEEPSESAYMGMLAALNNVVNKVHHNGWWMNKFANEATFNGIAEGKSIDVAKAGPVVLEIAKLSVGESGERLEKYKRAKRWKEKDRLVYPPESVILYCSHHPPPAVGVGISIMMGFGSQLQLLGKIVKFGGVADTLKEVKSGYELSTWELDDEGVLVIRSPWEPKKVILKIPDTFRRKDGKKA